MFFFLIYTIKSICKTIGEINDKERTDLLMSCCHEDGGACGGMYTANTMALASEVMGLTLPNSSSNPANSLEKIEECKIANVIIKNIIENIPIVLVVLLINELSALFFRYDDNILIIFFIITV